MIFKNRYKTIFIGSIAVLIASIIAGLSTGWAIMSFFIFLIVGALLNEILT